LDDWICSSLTVVSFCLMGQFWPQKTLIYLSFFLGRLLLVSREAMNVLPSALPFLDLS
jgi:hypothetical protein